MQEIRKGYKVLRASERSNNSATGLYNTKYRYRNLSSNHWRKTNRKVVLCHGGFHDCPTPIDALRHLYLLGNYSYKSYFLLVETETRGEYEKDPKVCDVRKRTSKEIRFVRYIKVSGEDLRKHKILVFRSWTDFHVFIEGAWEKLFEEKPITICKEMKV